MPRIYTCANQKGGVGKTTCTINLGAYLGYYGQRVLIVDLDPQANATSSLGIDKRTVRQGTYEVLIGSVTLGPHMILHNPRLKISLLPASSALAGAEVELIDLPQREQRLKQALTPILDRYDYILIDCPPSLSLLTINGLVAGKHGVIIPVQCEYLALEGLGQLAGTIQRVQAGLMPELTIRGVIMTMYDGRTHLSNDVVQEVRRVFPNQVFQSVIPRSVRLAEAPSHGLPISAYAPDSSAAQSFAALAREILEQDGIHIPDLKE
ncbi:MAG TPA: ParA family protein [Anaerolineaceae bacterium]|jgi:chromosome partitioning protein|nr:ParA family protein [Longilinea sp.]HNZ13425.1 ParA family protein [Anaerolineaceae bacterium]HOG79881.1 ParA family protein [Anaerolineaceae bacterium]HQN43348.1 ParA family protein [Anaerolineaceae bacterium]